MTEPIAELSLCLSESEVKKAVEDFLTYQQNLGKLLFLRLNSGDFIEVRGETRRRIKGCPAGTADYVVFQATKYELFHDRQSFGLCKSKSACRVTFLEIKSSKGKQSSEQKAFEILVKLFNARYFLVRDADALVEILG